MGRFPAEGPCLPYSLSSWQGDCRRRGQRTSFDLSLREQRVVRWGPAHLTHLGF
jgi:hypothetical protein